jgi:hypothetical protein
LKRKRILWLLHSILAPGTTRSRHRFFSKEIDLAMSQIHWFAVLYCGFKCERPEVFGKHCTGKASHIPFGILRSRFLVILYAQRMGPEPKPCK